MSGNVRVFYDPELRARLARRGTTAVPESVDDLRAENQRMRDEIVRLRAEIAQLRVAPAGVVASTVAGAAATSAADPPLDDSSLRFALMDLDD